MSKTEIRLTIKDEMKNKISMALKDPILQQCFEIICKENTELKLKLEALEGQTPWKDIKDKSELIKRLGKAKEISNNFLNACEDYEISEARAEARQFLDGEGCPDCFCKDCTKEDCETKKLGLVEVKK